MPPPFQGLNAIEFVRLLKRFPFERTVTALHLHHTWRPRGEDWRGHASLQAMHSMHTLQHGWSDIAHHVAIDPDGVIWTGRDWNRPPCSVPRQNGDRSQGPFMIMLIGDFTQNGERLAGAQYDQTLAVIIRLQANAHLPDEAIHLHAELSGANGVVCPGETIVRARLLTDLAGIRGGLDASAPPREETGTPPFGEDAENWFAFITTCTKNDDSLIDEPPDTPSEYTEATLGPAASVRSPA